MKKWIYPAACDPEKIANLARQLEILPLTAEILLQRGLEGEAARIFYNPSGVRLTHFQELPGTEAAGALLAGALRQGDRIAVFGDYDVDGVTASALILEFIQLRGGRADVYLPKREEDGYGLNRKVVEKIAASGAKLLITVDCGITALSEITLAKAQGLRVLVSDHHEPGPELPAADALVNPKATGPEELAILAGVGVAFQVVRAAADALGEKDPEQLRRHLDLVALGTVADVVPMLRENRFLTRSGMAVLNRGGRVGLRALLRATGLDKTSVNSLDLAFRLAPRLNAAGRLGDARQSLDLLLTQDAQEADRLAQYLNQQNSLRQNLEKTVLAEAETQVPDRELPPVLVVCGPGWPLGVVGLVASRLMEKYYRPCFVLSRENDLLRGSARSVAGFPLHLVLETLSPLLQKWGGHEMAAGVTLGTDQLDAFRAGLIAQAGQRLDFASQIPSLTIDAEPSLAGITRRFIRELQRFEPHGHRNDRPMLALSGVRICQPPRVVGERHLKLKVADEQDRFLDIIGFGLGKRAHELSLHNLIDIVGHASENVWNNSSTLQIEMKDFKPAAGA